MQSHVQQTKLSTLILLCCECMSCSAVLNAPDCGMPEPGQHMMDHNRTSVDAGQLHVKATVHAGLRKASV